MVAGAIDWNICPEVLGMNIIKSAFAASSSSTTEVVKTIGLFIMQSLVQTTRDP